MRIGKERVEKEERVDKCGEKSRLSEEEIK